MRTKMIAGRGFPQEIFREESCVVSWQFGFRYIQRWSHNIYPRPCKKSWVGHHRVQRRLFSKPTSTSACVTIRKRGETLIICHDFWPRPVYTCIWNFEKYKASPGHGSLTHQCHHHDSPNTAAYVSSLLDTAPSASSLPSK